MKKGVYLLSLMIAITGVRSISFAQPTVAIEEKVDGPFLSVENDTYDYGIIEQGANGDSEFIITNTGNQPLIISFCKGSCGCTVPLCPEEPIMPGESKVIKIHYDTKKIGPINKKVFITSNAVNSNSASDKYELYIKGNVKAKPQGGSPILKPAVPVK